ncbi:MAG TPA: hypothetical protein H9830_13175, partial [Candidatus Agrococcus pullicola]|nr:hypothetical protein [Candidatus Agrococcus pullicola]
MRSERSHDEVRHSSAPVTWEAVLDKLTDALPELVSDFMWQFQARELYASFDVPTRDLRETAFESLS